MNDEERQRLQEELAQLPSQRLAFQDLDFLARDEVRSLRLALEYLKPQLAKRELGVASTIVVFGSARVPAPEDVQERLSAAERAAEARPDDEDAGRELERARHQVDFARYYQEARRFAALVSQNNQADAPYEYVITTGGGPGIMEAANRGASERGLKTMGLNITIPFEQTPNPFITPELCFNFHYFALRKMHFLLHARALVIFPGGFGTLDELFDALTLIQTQKMPPIPIVMLGREYWSRVLSFDAMVEAGTISAQDAELVRWAEDAEHAWRIIREFWEDADPADEPGEEL